MLPSLRFMNMPPEPELVNPVALPLLPLSPGPTLLPPSGDDPFTNDLPLPPQAATHATGTTTTKVHHKRISISSRMTPPGRSALSKPTLESDKIRSKGSAMSSACVDSRIILRTLRKFSGGAARARFTESLPARDALRAWRQPSPCLLHEEERITCGEEPSDRRALLLG